MGATCLLSGEWPSALKEVHVRHDDQRAKRRWQGWSDASKLVPFEVVFEEALDETPDETKLREEDAMSTGSRRGRAMSLVLLPAVDVAGGWWCPSYKVRPGAGLESRVNQYARLCRVCSQQCRSRRPAHEGRRRAVTAASTESKRWSAPISSRTAPRLRSRWTRCEVRAIPTVTPCWPSSSTRALSACSPV